MFCADKIGTERRHVENDHDESKEVHSHHEPNPKVHSANANQPDHACLAIPNQKWIPDFQETNRDSCDGEQRLPVYEYLRIDHIERRADESAPHIRTIPPSAAEAFREATKKIDET